VDAIVRDMQGPFDQAPAEQAGPLSMRVGVVEPKRLGVGCERFDERRGTWLWLE
jgi:hypothetical protein